MHRALLGIQTHVSCMYRQSSYPQSRLSSSYSIFLLAFECALSYEVRYGIFHLEHHDSLKKFPALGHLGFCIFGLGMLILYKQPLLLVGVALCHRKMDQGKHDRKISFWSLVLHSLVWSYPLATCLFHVCCMYTFVWGLFKDMFEDVWSPEVDTGQPPLSLSTLFIWAVSIIRPGMNGWLDFLASNLWAYIWLLPRLAGLLGELFHAQLFCVVWVPELRSLFSHSQRLTTVPSALPSCALFFFLLWRFFIFDMHEHLAAWI